MPRSLESPEVSGHTAGGVPIAAGAGDCAAAALGVGVERPGPVSLVLGTSGVVFAALPAYQPDAQARVHVFCHAVPGGWHAMGVMLSAAGSLQWARDTFAPGVSFERLMAEAEAAPAGAGGIIFLPYLSGERTPHADPDARAALVGLSASHTRGHVMRAVLEGVAFGLADSFDLLRALGCETTVARASGGGARSDLWLRICASVLGVPVCRMSVDEGSAFGAAMLGGVAGGLFADCGRGRLGLRARARPDRPGTGLDRPLHGAARALPRSLPRSQGSARMTLSIGLLSTARINADLAAGARASSRVRVVAIASRELARAQAQASELGVDRAHGGYEALLADRDVDAVYVSLPNELHHEWTLRALAAGKHVLCEKPYSRCPATCRRPSRPPRRQASCWRRRSCGDTIRRRCVSSSSSPAARSASCAWCAQPSASCSSDPKDARLLTEPAGGGLMDVGCYCVSAARMLAGEPVSVTAQQLVTPSGLDRRLAATLAHERDVLTHFDCALDLPERSELEAIGSEGVLRVSDPWHSITTGIELAVGDGGPSTSTSRTPTRTPASSTTSRPPSPASIRRASG